MCSNQTNLQFSQGMGGTTSSHEGITNSFSLGISYQQAFLGEGVPTTFHRVVGGGVVLHTTFHRRWSSRLHLMVRNKFHAAGDYQQIFTGWESFSPSMCSNSELGEVCYHYPGLTLSLQNGRTKQYSTSTVS